MVKNLPAMQETQVWSPSWEGPLEKEIATHSSILTWKTPWIEEPMYSGLEGEPGGLPSMGLHRVGHDWSDLAAAAESMESPRVGHNWVINTHTHYLSLLNSMQKELTFFFLFNKSGEFFNQSGGPVVRTWNFHGWDPGSIPGQGTKIPHAVLCLPPHQNQSEVIIFLYLK